MPEHKTLPIPIPSRALAYTLLPAIAVLVIIAVSRQLLNVTIFSMTRDVTALAGVHPLAGVLSNLGILIWCAAATICLFAAVLFNKIDRRPLYRFFLFSFFLSAYLLLDDLFLIHEVLAPDYLGISEKVVYAGIFGYTLFYLIFFRNLILATDYPILLLAFALMALSIGSDSIFNSAASEVQAEVEYFIEDGLKWLGITTFCAYYLRTAFQFITGEVALLNDEVKPAAVSAGLENG